MEVEGSERASEVPAGRFADTHNSSLYTIECGCFVTLLDKH